MTHCMQVAALLVNLLERHCKALVLAWALAYGLVPSPPALGEPYSW